MSTCSSAGFPFLFYDNGDVVNGTLVGDSCIFSTASCSPDQRINECCYVNPELDLGKGDRFMFINWAIMFIPFSYAMHALGKAMTPEEGKMQAEEEAAKLPICIRAIKTKFIKSVLSWVWGFGVYAYMTALVVVPIFLKQSEQANMSVTERNTLMAAEAFYEPFYAVFKFIQEIMLIRISYAGSRGDKALMNRLVHIGLAAVIVSGLLSGIIATLLGVFDKCLAILTVPGLENDKAHYPGCSFVESVDISSILPYWMMEAWGNMGEQITGILFGYMMGVHEHATAGWLRLIGWLVFVWIWFPNIETYPNPMTLLGIAEISKDWITPVCFIGYLASPLGANIKERTGVELSAKDVISKLVGLFKKKTSSEIENNTAAEHKQENSSLIKEGLKLMFVDVTLHACMTASTYLALNSDGAVAYKLTALQSEMPAYGLAYSTGMGFIIIIMGPLLLSIGMPQVFVKFMRLNLMMLIPMVAIIIGSTVPFIDGLALHSGTNACAYATSSECLPYFTNVFGPNGEGGDFSLFFTYKIFPVAASFEAILVLLRSSLSACLDFDFMFYATIVAGISYIPCIAVVQYAQLSFQQQAIAYFTAYYIPFLVLIVAFKFRLFILLRRISKGLPGAWTEKKDRRVSTMAAFKERSERVLREVASKPGNSKNTGANNAVGNVDPIDEEASM